MRNPTGFGILWDMDGTLVDTAELHFAAWVRVCKENSRDFSRDDFAATFGRRNPEIVEFLFGKRFDATEVAQLGERKEMYYRTEAAKGVTLLPGVRSLLQKWHRAGGKQAIASSAPRANLSLILNRTTITSFMDAVVGMEDTQRGKPDPEVFLIAAAKLGLPPAKCLVIEDAIAGVQAAKAGGMRCLAVRFVGHHSEANLQQAGADRVVASLDNISIPDLITLLR
jgi:beta-phosphoglucomutase